MYSMITEYYAAFRAFGDGTAPEMPSKSALLEDIRYVGIMDE